MSKKLNINPSDNIKVSATAKLLKAVIQWPGKPKMDKFAPVPLMYWFPGNSIPDDFEDRFNRVKNTVRAVGPTRKNGLLASPFNGKLDPKPKLYDWKQSAGVWIGLIKNASPQLFLKHSTLADISGYQVLMGDGNLWHIPVATSGSPQCSIPFTDEIDAAGQWVKHVISDYAILCEIAREIAVEVATGNSLDRPDNELRAAACLAIGTNYDLSPVEIARLGLLTKEVYPAIFSALIDINTIKDIAKNEE